MYILPILFLFNSVPAVCVIFSVCNSKLYSGNWFGKSDSGVGGRQENVATASDHCYTNTSNSNTVNNECNLFGYY